MKVNRHTGGLETDETRGQYHYDVNRHTGGLEKKDVKNV